MTIADLVLLGSGQAKLTVRTILEIDKELIIALIILFFKLFSCMYYIYIICIIRRSLIQHCKEFANLGASSMKLLNRKKVRFYE